MCFCAQGVWCDEVLDKRLTAPLKDTNSAIMLADAWDESEGGGTTEAMALREATAAQVDLTQMVFDKTNSHQGSGKWGDAGTFAGA